jgi:diguanylate cyclase
MGKRLSLLVSSFGPQIRKWLAQPEIWAFFPAFLYFGHVYLGETFLLVFVIAAPLGLAVARQSNRTDPVQAALRGMPDRDCVLEKLEAALNDCEKGRSEFACFVIELDRMPELSQSYGPGILRHAIDLMVYRLSQVTRRGDILARLDESRVALVTAPMRAADPETLVQIAGRCQAAIVAPAEIEGLRLDLSISIGFATPRMPLARTPGAILNAAERALVQARRLGGGAIRAHDAKADGQVYEPSRLSEEIIPAIVSGQISALYQPIVDTDTGEVTAMDVTPVWDHPELGRIGWSEFRVAAITSGRTEDLHIRVLQHALNSLRSWRREGYVVPRLQISLGNLELANPQLGERLLWEIDRFDFGADVLGIAVKESAVTRQVDELIYANLRQLSGLGFALTITGFGTGSASMNVLRHIGVSDLRVDRAFVVNVDTDQDQRRLLNAVLQMADVLKVRILADGVDSISEHSMLAQLGCDCVQGLAIAPPMAFGDTHDWLMRHQRKVELGRVRA